MVRVRLSQQIYFVIALIVLASIVLGFITTNLLHRITSSNQPEEGRLPFYARLIDHMSPENHAAALETLQRMESPGTPQRFFLLGRDGKSIYPADGSFPIDWANVEKPKAALQVTNITAPSFWNPTTPPQSMIRVPGEIEQYLIVNRSTLKSTIDYFFWMIASLVISILVGIGLSVIFVFRAVRKRALIADEVLDEMQNGNLKARFPIKKMDEIGLAMSRFNKMADEIERLVEQIQQADKSRMKLLQELAHDLRTPVASLKNLLETLHSKGPQMDAKLHTELNGLALKEVDYFERLVEDLLILAQVTEPRFQAGQDRVPLQPFLRHEAETLLSHLPKKKALRLRQEFDSSPLVVTGDLHLLRRMLRNALDNAFSFANEEVTLGLHQTAEGEAEITILDDGPGFTAESSSSFGVRRISRRLDAESGGRLSVGLGSVIMKNIAHLHRGSVEIGNRDQKGAWVRIQLPLSHQ